MTKKFSITWTAPANDGGATITDYDIGVTPSGGSETVTSHGGTTPPHEVTGLVDGTTYGVRVRAVNSQGAGAWSSSVSQVAAVPSDAPTSLTLTPTAGGLDLAWTAPSYTGGSAISDYSVRYTPSGGSASTVLTGSTSTTHSLTGLTPGTSYDVQVAAVTAVGTGAYSSAVAATPLSTGITPNNDSSVRFYLPSGSTTFGASLGTTTGYWRMTDGTTTSAVFGNGYGALSSSGSYAHAYAYKVGTMTNLGSGTKVIRAYSCNSAGSPSGDILGVSIHNNTSDITAVDLSGVSQLLAVALFSSTSYGGGYIAGNSKPSSSQPSSIEEVRAVGVTVNFSSHGPYFTAHHGNTYPYGGIDISGQQLDASALDQFYTDLATSSASYDNELFVRGNPGVSGDTPSIATAKNYTVFGS